jgi:hypothetical protein
MDLDCKLGRGFDGPCCSRRCLTFSVVVWSCIIQMDHNASKRLPPTLLIDGFPEIRNSRLNKEYCIFHAFRNIQQIFDPFVTLDNQNEAFFELIFCFGISGTLSGWTTQHE